MNTDSLLVAFNTIAQQFNTSNEYMWNVLVRQQVAEGVFAIVLLVLTAISVLITSRYAMGRYKSAQIANCKIVEHEATLIIIGIVVCTLFALPSLISMSDIIGLFNPEYRVIKDLLP